MHLFLLLRSPSFCLSLLHAGILFGLAILNNFIPFTLICLGKNEIGPGLTSVLNANTSFWMLIIANVLISDENLNWNKLAGTAIMFGPAIIVRLSDPVWAKFNLVGASLSYVFALMIVRRLKGVPPAIIATSQMSASIIIMVQIVLAVYRTTGLFAARANAWLAMFALTLVGLCLRLYTAPKAVGLPPASSAPRW